MEEREALAKQVYGTDSHVHMAHALEGLDAERAGRRPAGAPHSVYQILRHMIFWQDIGLARIRGGNPAKPDRAAEGWTATVEPENEREWEEAVEEFSTGLWELEAFLDSEDAGLDRVIGAGRRRVVRQEVLMVLGHNSYHLGQIVLLRRQLEAWPPPKGGDTW